MKVIYFLKDYPHTSNKKLGEIYLRNGPCQKWYIWDENTILVERCFAFYDILSYIIFLIYCIIDKSLASKKDMKRIKKLQRLNMI